MATFLSNISGMFNKAGQSVLGVDVGSSSIKVIQLRRKAGHAVLETYGASALGPYGGTDVGRAVKLPPQKIAEALSDLMKEANVTTRRCGVSIPLSSSLVSFIEMPVLDTRQLAQMVPLEARKYIPVPITEVTLDWWMIPKAANQSPYEGEEEAGVVQKAQTVDVLLAVIHNEALHNFAEIISGAKLEAGFFEIEAFSAIRAVIERDTAPQLVIDMGAAATKLYIVEEGIVRMSHSINRGAQDITLSISQALGVTPTEAEKLKREQGLDLAKVHKELADTGATTLSYIFSEASRVMSGYQKKSRLGVRHVILSGGGAALKGVLPIAQSAFGVPVQIGNPFQRVETPAFLENVLRDAGPQFTVALGLALRYLQQMP